MGTDKFEVECGVEAGAVVPVRFGLAGVTQEVREVVDSWRGVDHSYFRVITCDGAKYILRHDETCDAWQISVFESGEAGSSWLLPSR